MGQHADLVSSWSWGWHVIESVIFQPTFPFEGRK